MTIAIELERPGSSPLDLVKLGFNAVRYGSVTNGGFTTAILVGPGDLRKAVPPLSVLRILSDTTVVFEGRVEDKEFDGGAGSPPSTEITAFGLSRLLQLASTRRMWSLRALQLEPQLPSIFPPSPNLLSFQGFITIANPSLRGFLVQGRNLACTVGLDYGGGSIVVPAGATPLKLAGIIPENDGYFQSWAAYDALGNSLGGGAITGFLLPDNVTTAFTIDLSTLTGIATISIYASVAVSTTYTPTQIFSAANLRLLGTLIPEDTNGGYYGGTLMRDAVSLVPGISPGRIDTGSEFLVQDLDRSTRGTIQSVVDELTAYYTKEWGVWEEGRFDWTQPNLSEPGWIVPTTELISWRLVETVDGLARDSYLTYTDPTDQRQKEASSQTPQLGNPFLRNGLLSDDVESPGLGFTPVSAAAYVQAANVRNSSIPAVQGTLVVAASKLLPRSTGGIAPALEIRAGDNVTVPDLASDAAFTAGEDNQTLFHVVQVDVDLAANTVTLTIAGYLPSIDVLNARLSAATKGATS